MCSYEQFKAVVLLSVVLVVVEAYPCYKEKLPNGDRVPHPCARNTLWEGVGHDVPGGGHDGNAFGFAFHFANHTWSKELCQTDSDGDGKRNGEELGDPNCVWIVGQNVTITDIALISHPGICEPLDAPACLGKNDFLLTLTECAGLVPNATTTVATPASGK